MADVRRAVRGIPHAEAVDGALRAAQHPTALAGELLAMATGMRGPPVAWDVLCRAVHELHVAGSRVTSASLRAFTRRLLAGDPPDRSHPPDAGGTAEEWDALIAKLNAEPGEATA